MQAKELFKLYDIGNKGYITREDLKNANNPMQLTNEIFESLDKNQDGIINFEGLFNLVNIFLKYFHCLFVI